MVIFWQKWTHRCIIISPVWLNLHFQARNWFKKKKKCTTLIFDLLLLVKWLFRLDFSLYAFRSLDSITYSLQENDQQNFLESCWWIFKSHHFYLKMTNFKSYFPFKVEFWSYKVLFPVCNYLFRINVKRWEIHKIRSLARIYTVFCNLVFSEKQKKL